MSDLATIKILQLYPKNMNIYGDWGNVLTLKKRLEWHGFKPELLTYDLGDELADDVDIIIGGGGQDSGQVVIQDDLLKIGPKLRELADDGMPMLVICGLYQLLGHQFITSGGSRIAGIGLLDIETRSGAHRLIGNVVAESQDFGTIVGYENHSGQTSLGPRVEPLAKVKLGVGNNERDGHEGARYKNVIGSYLHGSLLPKNPQIADWLIERAVINRFGEFSGAKIDDQIADKARQVAMGRPR